MCCAPSLTSSGHFSERYQPLSSLDKRRPAAVLRCAYASCGVPVGNLHRTPRRVGACLETASRDCCALHSFPYVRYVSIEYNASLADSVDLLALVLLARAVGHGRTPGPCQSLLLTPHGALCKSIASCLAMRQQSTPFFRRLRHVRVLGWLPFAVMLFATLLSERRFSMLVKRMLPSKVVKHISMGETYAEPFQQVSRGT